MSTAFAIRFPHFPDTSPDDYHRSVAYLGFLVGSNGERRHAWLCRCGMIVWSDELEAAKEAA